jgi:hypothetical protein
VLLGTLLEGLNDFCIKLGGPLIVVLFYWFRFRTLKGTRSYTTRALFYFGVITFITPFVLIYALLPVPSKLSPLTAMWLVIFIWIVPVIPVAWRSFCQGIAGIPSCAFGLRDELAGSRFELRPEDCDVIRRKFGRIGYQIDDFVAVQSTAIQSRLLKVAAIMHHLEQWCANGETFIERNSEHYDELLRVFDLISFKAVRALKSSAAVYGAIMHEGKVEPDDWHALDSLAAQDSPSNQLQLAAQNAAGGMLEDLRKDLDFMLDNLLLFIARAALAGERDFAGRKRRLEAIGFTMKAPSPGIMWTVAIAVAVTVAWSLLWLIALKGNIDIPGNKFFGVLRTFAVTPADFIVNFWLVHYCKRQYAFANEGMFGQPPIGFILSVGLWGALLILPLQVYFDYNQFYARNFAQVVLGDLPLLLFPWSIGTMTALLVQDSMWSSYKSRSMRRVLDGVVFGAGMVLAVLLIWVIHKMSDIPVMELLNSTSTAVIILGVFVCTFAFGFVIGYLAIARIRESSSSSATGRALMPDEALVHA